jgi:hypothetical protein
MAYKKLDSKQLPQVIILGLACVGFFGWAGFQLLKPQADAAPAPTVGHPQAAAPNPAATSPAATTGKGTEVAARPTGADGQLVPAGLGFPKGYNPDPFRPAAGSMDPVVVRPSAPPPPRNPWPDAPSLPGPEAVAPSAPPGPPPAPPRPTVAVTGIIDVLEGTDMALVEANAEQRIIQVGDMIDAYRVKKIGMDGILLVRGSDRFFVSLNAVESLAAKG